jgi:hypothetical protein
MVAVLPACAMEQSIAQGIVPSGVAYTVDTGLGQNKVQGCSVSTPVLQSDVISVRQDMPWQVGSQPMHCRPPARSAIASSRLPARQQLQLSLLQAISDLTQGTMTLHINENASLFFNPSVNLLAARRVLVRLIL